MDNRQYRQIVDDYADMVYRIALNRRGAVPDAEDVVQAVFLNLYDNRRRGLATGSSAMAASHGGRGRTRRRLR